MSIDLEYIKENYSKMEDFKLERIAKHEASTLKPEVLPILISEIKKRGLDLNLIKGIDAQVKELTSVELQELIEKVKGLSCPSFGCDNQALNGGVFRKVRSYLVLTQYKKNNIIACASCLEKERKRQLIKNTLLGWWGFPWGLIRTPMAIINHFIDNTKKERISESILVEFVKQNVGELRTNWGEEDKLVNFINHINTNT